MKAHDNHKCLQCRETMTGKRENYRYDGSGLPGVILQDVMVYRCPHCGEHEVAIPNLEGLHNALAQMIVSKKERLGPEEIRFLRTHLGYSSAEFARKLGVALQTVSRWERYDKPLGMKPAVDRFIRLMVLAGDAVKGYPLEEMATAEPKRRTLRVYSTKTGWAEASAAG
jgi:putative zinc finger/helix-turn-helix YgiT family protein